MSRSDIMRAVKRAHTAPEIRFFAGLWGEERIDRQGTGKLAVAKHTNAHPLLSPCIILTLPTS